MTSKTRSVADAAVARGAAALSRYDQLWSGRIDIVRLDLGSAGQDPIGQMFAGAALPVASAQYHLGRPPAAIAARRWDVDHGFAPTNWENEDEVGALNSAWRVAVLDHRRLTVARWMEEACSFAADVRGPWVAAHAALARRHDPGALGPDLHVFLDKLLESGLLNPQGLMDGLWLGQPQIEAWLRERGWKNPADRYPTTAALRDVRVEHQQSWDGDSFRVLTVEAEVSNPATNDPLQIALAFAAATRLPQGQRVQKGMGSTPVPGSAQSPFEAAGAQPTEGPGIDRPGPDEVDDGG